MYSKLKVNPKYEIFKILYTSESKDIYLRKQSNTTIYSTEIFDSFEILDSLEILNNFYSFAFFDSLEILDSFDSLKILENFWQFWHSRQSYNTDPNNLTKYDPNRRTLKINLTYRALWNNIFKVIQWSNIFRSFIVPHSSDPGQCCRIPTASPV